MNRNSTLRRRVRLGVMGVALPATIALSLVAPSSQATPTVTASTPASLGLEGASNTRDLGGIEVEQGGHIRTGMLVRAPELSHLTPADVTKVESLGLQTVIDLRTPEEAADDPDPSIPGASNVQIPLLPPGSGIVHAFDDATTTEDYREVIDSFGGPVGLYVQLQHELADPYAVSQLRAVFQEILDADGAPVMFHCTAGMDRTGITAYLLLRVLGVSHADAMSDYLASNVDGAERLQGYVEFFESLGYSHDVATRGSFLQSEFLQITVDHLLSVYGTFDGLVQHGLGLSSAEVQQLRTDYVVPGAPRAAQPGSLRVVTGPTVKGKAVVGQKLKIRVGMTSPAAAGVTIQWMVKGKPVAGATHRKFKVTKRLHGKRVRAQVIYERPGYTPLVVLTKARRVR